MFWDNFQILCKKRGETPNGVCKKLGFSNASSTHWKKGTLPGARSLQKIADYFDTTTDALLSGNAAETLKKEKPANDDEIDEAKMREIYAIYSALSPERRRQLDDYLAFLKSQQDD